MATSNYNTPRRNYGNNVFLTPIRERPTASSIIASAAALNQSRESIGAPLSAKLIEVRNAKKQLETERQILLNRIKYLEEEELRAKLRLAQANTHQQKHLESRKMKRAVNEDLRRSEEYRKNLADSRKSQTKEEKERKAQLKDRLSSFEKTRRKEVEEIKQKKEYIKNLNETLKAEMKNDNYARADSQRKYKIQAKNELAQMKSKINQQRVTERKTSKQFNEETKAMLREADLQQKSQQVQYIRKTRVNLESVQAYLTKTNHEKVADSIQTQLSMEEQWVNTVSKSIDELKQEELVAKRRLEKAQQSLENIGAELTAISSVYERHLSPKKLLNSPGRSVGA